MEKNNRLIKLRKKNYPEYELSKVIHQYLMVKSKVCKFIHFHIPNEGKRAKSTGYMLKQIGMRTGIADYCIVSSSKVVFFEVKAGKNKLTDAQEEFKRDCEKRGISYEEIRNIEEFIKKFSKYFST